MLYHPYMVSANADIRYRQRLEEAEAERLYQRLNQNRLSLPEQMGDFFIQLGQKLKSDNQPKLANFNPSKR